MGETESPIPEHSSISELEKSKLEKENQKLDIEIQNLQKVFWKKEGFKVTVTTILLTTILTALVNFNRFLEALNLAKERIEFTTKKNDFQLQLLSEKDNHLQRLKDRLEVDSTNLSNEKNIFSRDKKEYNDNYASYIIQRNYLNYNEKELEKQKEDFQIDSLALIQKKEVLNDGIGILEGKLEFLQNQLGKDSVELEEIREKITSLKEADLIQELQNAHSELNKKIIEYQGYYIQKKRDKNKFNPLDEKKAIRLLLAEIKQHINSLSESGRKTKLSVIYNQLEQEIDSWITSKIFLTKDEKNNYRSLMKITRSNSELSLMITLDDRIKETT